MTNENKTAQELLDAYNEYLENYGASNYNAHERVELLLNGVKALTPPSDDAVSEALDLLYEQAMGCGGETEEAINWAKEKIRQALQSRAGQEGESAHDTNVSSTERHPSRADAVDVDGLSIADYKHAASCMSEMVDDLTKQIETLTQKPDDGMVNEWLPIESAPKDGTVIIGNTGVICWEDKYDETDEGWCYPQFTCGGTLYEGNNLINEVDYPTHWMPLPTPPAQHLTED